LGWILIGDLEANILDELARFGLSQIKAKTLIEFLSGGERMRLLLRLIPRSAPHLLILDDPRDHRDINPSRCLFRYDKMMTMR
jgi:ATPase subunit of ABC transporter with duplicated ATPase domains